jgi:hypothetical protein
MSVAIEDAVMMAYLHDSMNVVSTVDSMNVVSTVDNMNVVSTVSEIPADRKRWIYNLFNDAEYLSSRYVQKCELCDFKCQMQLKMHC